MLCALEGVVMNILSQRSAAWQPGGDQPRGAPLLWVGKGVTETSSDFDHPVVELAVFRSGDLRHADRILLDLEEVHVPLLDVREGWELAVCLSGFLTYYHLVQTGSDLLHC